LHNEICAEERRALLGGEVEVLVERRNRDEKYLKGRTRCWKNVIFGGDDSLIGTLQNVKVTGFSHQTLIGESPGLFQGQEEREPLLLKNFGNTEAS
jgi:tRNA-2-methylthio-N6-dimethylallyladenosine synthase